MLTISGGAQRLVVLGFILIALTPLVGPIPGPGGVIVFAAGLSLVLKYSGWAKRLYVRFKRRHPKKGRWADWGLRRASATPAARSSASRRKADERRAPIDFAGALAYRRPQRGRSSRAALFIRFELTRNER